MKARSALLAALLLAAAPTRAQDAAPWIVEEPAAALAALEDFLVASPFVRFDLEARSDSVFTADLRGSMSLAPDGQARLHAEGIFGDREIDHVFISDGRRMTILPSETPNTCAETAPHLRRALILGFTRMGVLHNLARLTAGREPDHADGGVAEWVTAANARWAGEGRALTFDILVDGREIAEATLWLDPDHGLPLMRRQTVRFPGGEMLVEERYDGWSFEPAREDAFTID